MNGAGRTVRGALCWPDSATWQTALFAALLLVALVLSFGQALRMSDHNEEMFVTAGVLAAQGQIPYRDFSYVQMPYLPFIFGELFRLFDMANPVLVARIFNWLAWAIGAFLIGLGCKLAGGSVRICLAAACLYLANPCMLRITHEASAYALPAALAIGQAVLCLRMSRSACARSQSALAFFTGALGGLAVGVKLYFLPVVLPYILLAGFAQSRKLDLARLAWAAAGFCFALLPAALLFASCPREFLFNNLLVHGHNTAAYRALDIKSGGLVPNMQLGDKIRFVAVSIVSSPTIVATIVLGLWSWAHSDLRAALRGSPLWPHILAAVFSLSLAIAVPCWMTPSFPQYLALMMPYGILLAGLLASNVLPRHAGTHMWLCMVCVAVSVVSVFSIMNARALVSPSQMWNPVQRARIGAEIRSKLEASGAMGKLATINPVNAINAGVPFYDQFSTGPFVYPLADRLSVLEQDLYVVVSSNRVAGLFDADPPAAILAGIYPPGWFFNDAALRSYAESRGYDAVKLSRLPKATLYIRPKSR